ncbi:MAG: DUF5018 domain-containing protein [Bacteroidales bacterium]
MKRSLLLNALLFVTLFSALSLQDSYSQALLIENFDYTAGTLLTNVGWTAHSGSGTQPVDVVVPGLTFTGYPLSDIGGAAQIDNTGEDVHKTFTAQTSGTVYAAFTVKVIASAEGYFMHLGGNPIGTTFRGKLFLVGAADPFNFGLSVGSNTATPVTSGSYTYNSTYLFVLKYEIVDGPVNNIVSLHIISGAVPATEPGTPTIGPLTDATQSEIEPGSIALRQFSGNQNVVIDGIRIGKTWAEAVTDPLPVDVTAPVATFVPANAAVDVTPDVKPTITFDKAVLKTDGSVLADADLATLVSFRKTDAAGENVPFTATIDAEKKVITVTPSSALLNSQVYYLAVGSVEDAKGNESTASGVTFTTLASTAGTVTITGPVGGETFHAGDATSITWTSANITDIFIEVWSPNAGTYSWSSFVATTPAAAGKADITVPADAPYGVEYKIRVSDKSNAAVSSESGAFTVIGVATTITDLRTRFADKDVVKLSGEATVTFLRPANRNQKYIQDANAGLLIDDASGVLTTVVAAGDKIEGLEGKIAFYGGVMEIVPTVATVTVKSGGNTVTIPELTVAQYLTDFLKYESMVIKLKTVTITEGNGTATFAESTNYNVTDGTSTVGLRTFKSGDGNVVGTVIPTAMMHLTALAGFYNTTAQVYPMNTSGFYLLSSNKAITAFAFNGLTPAVTGTINEASKTIALTVPASTARTSLVPTITVSEKSTVDPASGTAKDFTNPVTYTVTAEDGSTAVYTVTVSLSTGVSDALAGQYRIYPVPAHSEVTATGIEDVKCIEIFDVTGNKLITVICEGEDLKVISVSQLVRGVYFIKFTTPQGAVMKRFVKE